MKIDASKAALCILDAFHTMPSSRSAAYYLAMVEAKGQEEAHAQILRLAEELYIAWQGMTPVQRMGVIQLPICTTWAPSVLEDLAIQYSYKGFFYQANVKDIYATTLRLLEGSKL